jgi:hypothetical protein
MGRSDAGTDACARSECNSRQKMVPVQPSDFRRLRDKLLLCPGDHWTSLHLLYTQRNVGHSKRNGKAWSNIDLMPRLWELSCFLFSSTFSVYCSCRILSPATLRATDSILRPELQRRTTEAPSTSVPPVLWLFAQCG